jgi:hypothetical protein
LHIQNAGLFGVFYGMEEFRVQHGFAADLKLYGAQAFGCPLVNDPGIKIPVHEPQVRLNVAILKTVFTKQVAFTGQLDVQMQWKIGYHFITMRLSPKLTVVIETFLGRQSLEVMVKLNLLHAAASPFLDL